MTRYYYAQNASQSKAGLQFELIDVLGGTVVGVYKAAAAAEIAALESLRADARSGVEEISEEIYLLKKKIKPTAFNSYQQSSPTIQPIAQIKAGGVLLADGKPPPKPVVESKEIKTVEEAVVVEKVELPPLPTAEPQKSRRKTRATD